MDIQIWNWRAVDHTTGRKGVWVSPTLHTIQLVIEHPMIFIGDGVMEWTSKLMLAGF